jgi:hypothetical protein
MTPEEQAAAAAAAVAAAQQPTIDYTKFDYAKLGAEIAKIQAASTAADQRKKDTDAAAAAAATAADDKRKADEAAAAAAVAAGKQQKPWNVKEAPEFLKLQADLAAKVAQDEAREKKAELKERTGTVKAALSDYTFATPGAKANAEKLFLTDIKLGEDGETYLGPDGSPADQYIAKMLETEMDYLLKPKDIGGSGARNGGSRKETAVDIDSIKPGMKAEDRARVYARIAELNHGR